MKTSVYIAMSLDGFIARENGGLDWLPGSDGRADAEQEDFGYQAFIESVDVLVMGRHTFECVLQSAVWPYGNRKVIVLSSSLNGLPGELADSVQLRSCPAEALYQELQNLGFAHLYVDGGVTIQGFLKSGLIDEITITKIPVLIGSGIPLFGPLVRDVNLHHIKTTSFVNGFVQSTYRVVKVSQTTK
ncbi:MAG: dihydrofolate reductase family protein [bacterium]